MIIVPRRATSMRSALRVLARFAVAGASLAFASPAEAISFVSAFGGFQNPSGPGTSISGNVVQENLGGPYLNPQPTTPPAPNLNPTGIRWGVTNGNKSGLRFIGVNYDQPGFSPIAVPTDGSEFTINDALELDHLNFPISISNPASQLTGVDLFIQYTFLNDQNVSFNVNQIIPISIDETPNVAPCDPPGSPPCPDVITLTQPSVSVIPINGGPEFLQLTLSFPASGTNQIITNEGQQNPFLVDIGFRRAPAPLPFGAVGGLSLLAGGIGRLRKRYNKTASEVSSN